MTLFVAYILTTIFRITKSDTSFLPNLPMGKYQIVFDTLSPCESTQDHLVQYNVFLSKKSPSLTEVKGNITLLTNFDDSIYLDTNLASWSSLGGWKENSAVYKASEGCSNVKRMLGDSWISFTKAFNFPSANCPLPEGTYVSSGMDINDFRKNNFPKVYFYGKYKAIFRVKTQKGKLLGCFISQLKVLRPWEVTN